MEHTPTVLLWTLGRVMPPRGVTLTVQLWTLGAGAISTRDVTLTVPRWTLGHVMPPKDVMRRVVPRGGTSLMMMLKLRSGTVMHPVLHFL